MNYRKIIILPACFLLSHFLYIGCCKCVDSDKGYFNIGSVSSIVRGPGNASPVDSGATTTVDSLFLNYNFDIRCVASHQQNPLGFLVNSTYACKCGECGSAGLKTKLLSMQVSSDSVYNGMAANTSLNDLFKVRFYGDTYISIDSMVSYMNSNRNYGISMLSTTKPGNNLLHRFKLKMVFVDGSEIAAATIPFRWL